VRPHAALSALAPPVLQRAARRALDEVLARRYARAPVAYAPGYYVHRNRVIADAVRDPQLARRFRDREELPAGYAQGLDERCIEYPWCLAHLPAEARLVLDAGSVLNHEPILTAPALEGRTLHIITLAPEEVAFWRRGISYLYGDLRDLPMKDACYDAVVCLSTLEHVGMENLLYARGPLADPGRSEDVLVAMRELVRVLRPGGVLLLSVPYGVYENRGIFQQFDRDMLARAVAASPYPVEVRADFFRFHPEGWRRTTQEACDDARFGVWGSSEQGRATGRVPAAEAVACVRLVRR